MEAIQRRAIRIMYDYTFGMPYTNSLYVANIPSLFDRRERLSRNFCKSVLKPTSCLFYTLPPERDASVISRLRTAPKFPRIPTRTNEYLHSPNKYGRRVNNTNTIKTTQYLYIYIYVYLSRRQNRPTARIKKQTDRQTNKQTLQLIPQLHSNTHNIKRRKITWYLP